MTALWPPASPSASSAPPRAAALAPPLSHLGTRQKRKTVPAGPVHKVKRSVARQRLEQRAAVLAQRAGLEHLLEDWLAVLEHAQVERDRSGVHAGYPRHIIRGMSSTKDKPRTYGEDEIPAQVLRVRP